MTQTPYNSVNDERIQSLVKWLADNDFKYNNLNVVPTDAGFRRYFRLQTDNSSLVAVDAPPEHEDTSAFLDIAERLASSGLHPPQIHCYSTEMGFLVVEDLGQSHIQQTLHKAPDNTALAADLYQTAMQGITQMQTMTDTTALPVCDGDFLRAELELFTHWYLDKHLGISIDHAQLAIINSTFETLINSATEQPYRFMHRDYHCRNLMVLANNSIGIIDFQGAMLGPITYDPVSLLKDAYLDWPTDFQNPLIDQHHNSVTPTVDSQTYARWFDFMGLQRHLKILGIFCRLHYRDNKPDYLDNLCRVRSQVENTVAKYPQLSEFSRLLSHCHQKQDKS